MSKYRMDLLAVATALLAILLVGCSNEPTPSPTSAPIDTPILTSTARPSPTHAATPSPSSEPIALPAPTSTPTRTVTPLSRLQPTPEVLGDCRDGMRLESGKGCRYEGGGSLRAKVVLSALHDGSICREGGPAKQFGITIDNLRLCTNGFERDEAFGSDIAIRKNPDGSWTFYESTLSASRRSATPTSEPTATSIPSSQAGSQCSAGMEMREGDHCTVSIPRVSVGTDRFEIRGGSGCYGNVCGGTGLRLNDFVATKNPDGSWTIESVPITTPRPGATPVLTAMSTPQSSPTPTTTPLPTPSPTPVGPAVEVSNLECGGERISFGSISYEVTGEIQANQDIEDVQIGFGEDSFREMGWGNWVYFGHPGTSVTLGSMSAGESRLFELSFSHPFELRECGIHVVWK